MTTMSEPYRLLVLGDAEGVAAAIGAVLVAGGSCVRVDADADAVLIDGMDAGTETPFLDLSDADFAAQVIAATVSRVALLQDALVRVGSGGASGASIVVIGTDAHLGRWHGTGQAAASAAFLGIMRSVAMEYGRHGVRANMLALPLGSDAGDAVMVDDAARQAIAVFGSRSITGETILIDAGANLKFRQARRR